jgi:hypothetical protein
MSPNHDPDSWGAERTLVWTVPNYNSAKVAISTHGKRHTFQLPVGS